MIFNIITKITSGIEVSVDSIYEEGLGVVGEQLILLAGGKYSFESFCNQKTTWVKQKILILSKD